LRPAIPFTITTAYLATIGIAAQVLGDPAYMILAVALAITTVTLAMKAKDKSEPRYIMVSFALNLFLLPILLLKVTESPLIRTALLIPAMILQLEEFLNSA